MSSAKKGEKVWPEIGFIYSNHRIQRTEKKAFSILLLKPLGFIYGNQLSKGDKEGPLHTPVMTINKHQLPESYRNVLLKGLGYVSIKIE